MTNDILGGSDSARWDPEKALKPTKDKVTDEYVIKINSCWRKSAESIIEVGRLLNELKKKVDHGKWINIVVQRLPFGLRVAQRLMMIASNPVLSNATHVSHLPPSYGTLYALTDIPDRELEEYIKTGLIFPGMQRWEVGRLPGNDLARLPDALARILTVARRFNPSQLCERVPHLDIDGEVEEKRAIVLMHLSRYFRDLAKEYWAFETGHDWGEPRSKQDFRDIAADKEVWDVITAKDQNRSGASHSGLTIPSWK
ncbi:MAG: DUF3102 domain-containing protein [Mesorhizobium sp.]|uniref:DUF3102 domain-containing protein n=1 Tax=Mesorhizobium sp. TaxID=1871066 RepID=UPI00120A3BEA|nr:DUF3102 domain-containing protein [Mesorhizobium sp.]TIP00379.1 MAG: DUF3102 domain-containing protein [Mesorhizobium sp.]